MENPDLSDRTVSGFATMPPGLTLGLSLGFFEFLQRSIARGRAAQRGRTSR
jgi:hypothetical protein